MTSNVLLRNQHPSKHLLVFKTSSRHVLKNSSTRLQGNNFSSFKTSSRRLKISRKTSWRRLKHVFTVTIFRLSRRLKDILQDVLKASSRGLGRQKIVALKTSSRRLENISWRSLKDMSWRSLEDIPWRRLQTSWKQKTCLLGISVSNQYKSVYLWSNKSIFKKTCIWQI